MNSWKEADASAVAPAPPQERRGRATGLMVGLGCLGVLVMGCLFVAGIFVVVGLTMRGSDAYQLALAKAQREPSVTTAIGAPVSAGWLTTGQVNVVGQSGNATLDIPISGPRGSGTLAVVAHKSAGKWTLRTLTLHITGHPAPLDLLAATPP